MLERYARSGSNGVSLLIGLLILMAIVGGLLVLFGWLSIMALYELVAFCRTWRGMFVIFLLLFWKLCPLLLRALSARNNRPCFQPNPNYRRTAKANLVRIDEGHLSSNG